MEEEQLDLYSRQLYVYGESSMAHLTQSKVLLSGLGGCGLEAAKNVSLAGVSTLMLHDTKVVTQRDVSSSFHFTEAHLGMNRAVAAKEVIMQLNQYVVVEVSHQTLLDQQFLDQFSVVVLTDGDLNLALAVNALCRRLVYGGVRGLMAFSFVDFGDRWESSDANGEPAPFCTIQTMSEEGVYSVIEEDVPHGFHAGDLVEIEGARHTIASRPSKSEFVLESAGASFAPGTSVNGVKKPFTFTFSPLVDSLRQPRTIGTDFTKSSTSAQCIVALQAATKMKEAPRVWSESSKDELLKEASAFIPITCSDTLFGEITCSELDESLLSNLSYLWRLEFHPLCAYMGAVIAQEALKGCMHKFSPQNQWLVVDCLELSPLKSPSFSIPESPTDNVLVECLGVNTCELLRKTSLFVVGSGALGCEFLKNFAMIDVASAEGARLVVTDGDTIAKSNLNRQFLFRPKDIDQPKSTTAAAAARVINPRLNVEARLDMVADDTKHIFTDDFFRGMDIVVNALDSIPARQYVDSRCVAARKPLLESGTLATKGHVQVVIPFRTQSYTDSRDPVSKTIPFCTLRSFPSKIEHCVEWASEIIFSKHFVIQAQEFNKLLSHPSLFDSLSNHPNYFEYAKSIQHAVKQMMGRPKSFEDCVLIARAKFDKLFVHAPMQLMHMLPLGHKNEDGSDFWAPPRRPPKPLAFDANDALHLAFITSYARQLATCWSLPVVDGDVKGALAAYVGKPFVPKDKHVITDVKQAAPAAESAPPLTAGQFRSLLEDLCNRFAKDDPPQLCVVEFDKDVPKHVVFAHACTNLRARVYGVPEGTELEVKRISGRIAPAIATTTSAIAALVMIEFIKLVLKVPLHEHKNLTANLGLPFYLFSEPSGAVISSVGEYEFTKWDSCDIRIGIKGTTVGDLREALMAKFGVEASSIVSGNNLVFMKGLPSCENDALILKRALKWPTENPSFVPLHVSFSLADGSTASGPVIHFYKKSRRRKKKKSKTTD